MVNGLNYEGFQFPVFKTDFCKIEQKYNIRYSHANYIITKI